jgi:hypothetical protein
MGGPRRDRLPAAGDAAPSNGVDAPELAGTAQTCSVSRPRPPIPASSERRSTGLSRPAVSEAERTARACRASALAPGMRSAKRSMARTMGTPFRSVSAMARYEAHDGDVLMTQGVCRRFWRKSNPVPRRPPYSISKTEIRLPELAMMCSTCVEKSTTLIRGSLPTFRSTVRRTAGSSRAANGLGDGLRDGTYQLASLASRHLIGRAWGRTQMRQ